MKQGWKDQKDFMAGSFVGMGQVMIGVALATRFGPVAAFFASTVLYFSAYKFYRWATDEQK